MNKKIAIIFLLYFSCLFNLIGQSKQKFKPAKKKVEGKKYVELIGFLENSGSSSLMMVQSGKVIFQWGDVKKKIVVHSIRKTFLNALFGIASEEGKMDTSITMLDAGIANLLSLENEEPYATIADLMRSRSGIFLDAAGVGRKIRSERPKRHAYGPGEYFYYNNWDFNTLAYLIEDAYNENIFSLFNQKIAGPLGFEDYHAIFTTIDGEDEEATIPHSDGFYQYEKSKSLIPIPHFRISARDLAKFGQLYLNQGVWNGKQILSEGWIKNSLKPYSVYDKKHGIAYGMLWNVLMRTKKRENKAFFHTGVSVHLLGVYPAMDLVLIHRVNTEEDYDFGGMDFSKMLELVFDLIQ